MNRSPEHRIWQGIKNRCLSPTSNHYAAYRGRGITICEEWRVSFSAFLRDMGRRPSAEHSVERRNNDGNYEPGNCIWATRTEQGTNKRNNVRIAFQGETLTLAEWARKTGLDDMVIKHRIKAGWSINDALTTPAKPGQKIYSTGRFKTKKSPIHETEQV